MSVPHETARILVVDDVAENRDLLVRRLQRLGIKRVEQAVDGADALAQLAASQFDLVLLDIMMPGVNGFEVLERLAPSGLAERMPIIVVSAMSDMQSVVKCVTLGADDYLFKPFEPTLLNARVLASLEKKRLRDATRTALAIRHAELSEARRLQKSLVPPPCRRQGLVVEALLDPAREVGGDLVDHFAVGEDHYTILLGDVANKGAGAALVMARAHSLFRGLLTRPDAASLFADPAVATTLVNRMLSEGNDAGTFTTLLVATLDLRTGVLSYVRAGHVPPWLSRAGAGHQLLDAFGGFPLGVLADGTYTTQMVQLSAGDCVLVVSDGITEAEAPDGAQFGEAGVEACLDEPSSADLLPRLLAACRAHEAGEVQSDDVAMLLLKFGAAD